VRVLVIGGTGFIGPHVVRRLASMGHDVAVFHRGRTEADLSPGVRHLLGDRDLLRKHRAEFQGFGPDVVLDTRPMTGIHAVSMMEVMRGVAGRVVALSSADVYRAYGLLTGKEPGPPEPVPITEDAPLRAMLYPYRGPSPRDPADPLHWVDDYDKIPVERAVLSDPSLPGTILRLPAVYGPGDDQHRLFPYLKRMDDGRPAILLGEAQSNWRWTRGYVADVAAAIALAVIDNRAIGQTYNIGEPDPLTEADWVRALGQMVGWRGEVVALPPPRLPVPQPLLNFSQDLVTDTTRIRRELGYCEETSRAEALIETVCWERKHPPAIFDPATFDYDAEDAALAGE
jgi:nucleoside-diphosphate-sugar epimerase